MKTAKYLNLTIKTIKRIQMNKLMAMVILFSLAACQSKVSEDAEGEEPVVLADEIQFSDEQLNLAGIVSDQLEQMILSDELGCNGSVEMPPQSLVSVTLPLDGYVKRTRLCFNSETFLL